MLHVPIAPPSRVPSGPGIWEKFKALFRDPTTWKSFFYLILKFPFGIASFVTLITTFAVSGALILAPLTYQITRIDLGRWRVDNKDDATFCCLLGLVLLVLSFHLVNGLAFMWGRFAQMMLGPDPPAGH